MAQIILIEPDWVLAETYRQVLYADEHTVVLCASAQAAVLAADQVVPDIVIIELQLIEHSGIEFLCEFRSYTEWRSIPIIIHSQVPPSEFSSQRTSLESELGVCEYLYKPQTSLRQLLDTVRTNLVVKV